MARSRKVAWFRKEVDCRNTVQFALRLRPLRRDLANLLPRKIVSILTDWRFATSTHLNASIQILFELICRMNSGSNRFIDPWRTTALCSAIGAALLLLFGFAVLALTVKADCLVQAGEESTQRGIFKILFQIDIAQPQQKGSAVLRGEDRQHATGGDQNGGHQNAAQGAEDVACYKVLVRIVKK